MTGRFWLWFKTEWDKIDIFEANDFKVNLFDILDDKLQFDDNKKLKYFQTLVEEKSGRKTSFLGKGFTTMIKQGEVYSMDENTPVDEFGRIIEHESRPRNISKPSSASCGTLTLIQSLFWKKIKKILPGFIQGLTKEEMMSVFKENVTTDMKSISIDGSKFDSTQYADLMQVTDDQFWDIVLSDVERILEDNEYENFSTQAKNL